MYTKAVAMLISYEERISLDAASVMLQISLMHARCGSNLKNNSISIVNTTALELFQSNHGIAIWTHLNQEGLVLLNTW